jgi:hypothetical protein
MSKTDRVGHQRPVESTGWMDENASSAVPPNPPEYESLWPDTEAASFLVNAESAHQGRKNTIAIFLTCLCIANFYALMLNWSGYKYCDLTKPEPALPKDPWTRPLPSSSACSIYNVPDSVVVPMGIGSVLTFGAFFLGLLSGRFLFADSRSNPALAGILASLIYLVFNILFSRTPPPACLGQMTFVFWLSYWLEIRYRGVCKVVEKVNARI